MKDSQTAKRTERGTGWGHSVGHGYVCAAVGAVTAKVLFPVGVGLCMVGCVHLCCLADPRI